MVEHKVLLRGAAVRGCGADPSVAGLVLRQLDNSLHGAVDVAFRRSSGAGRRQPWLRQAGQARLQHAEKVGADELAIYFQTPRFGDVATEYYAQPRLFDDGPNADQTAFDVLEDAIGDVMAGKTDSDRFDVGLLKRFHNYQSSVFARQIDELVITRATAKKERCRLSPALPDRAKELYLKTPLPSRTRITGRLDMIEASTLAFALVLRSGQRVRGIWKGDDFETLRQLVNTEVVATGTAVYRPSSALLRLDAETLAPPGAADHFFQTMPVAVSARPDLKSLVREQRKRGGIAAMWGQVPAEETDDEFLAAISGDD